MKAESAQMQELLCTLIGLLDDGKDKRTGASGECVCNVAFGIWIAYTLEEIHEFGKRESIGLLMLGKGGEY